MDKDTARCWLVIDKSTKSYKLKYEPRTREEEPHYYPPPPVTNNRRKGRIPFEAWQYIYAEEIDAFMSRIQEDVQDCIASDEDVVRLDQRGFDEDAIKWLYYNSSCALRENQEHFPISP